MDEDLIDEEMETRTFANIQNLDRVQTIHIEGDKVKEANFIQNTQPTVNASRRYWHKGDDNFQKNNSIENAKQSNSKKSDNEDVEYRGSEVLNISTNVRLNSDAVQTKPKEEKIILSESRSCKSDVLVTNAIDKSEKRQGHNVVVELQSSDDDDVVEVALPPKPTITIESSDDEELTILTPGFNKNEIKTAPTFSKKRSSNSPKSLGGRQRDTNREVSASPVPSVVSSVSDDFIRGDCIAFNISSRKPEQPTFDFSVHGSDLSTPTTPMSQKKKKKKNKNKTVSQTIVNAFPPVINTQECFVTPKNKDKNKKGNKSNTPKVNLSQIDTDTNKTKSIQQKKKLNTAFPVAVPNADIYHTDINSTNADSSNIINQSQEGSVEKIEILTLNSQPTDVTQTTSKENHFKDQGHFLRGKPSEAEPETIDLVDDLSNTCTTDIPDKVVMGNVTGFEHDEDYSNFVPYEISSNVKLGSTKVPEILSEHMDFDTKTGIFRFKNMRKLSEHSLKVDMEKFYNESWGGEDFNHKEILKHLPRDKSLWRIDPKDRFSTPSKRKIICNYCNRPGHRDELCYRKPLVCHMCGEKGHREPRCPNKICVNCGSPNYIFSSSCRNCASWNRITCAECGQLGHPSTHCPDLWRRYHNTIDTESPLVENRHNKQHYQLFCSGCSRRGHLIHQCRSTLPFSGLAINSPYVANYISIYPPTPKDRSPCIQEFGLNSEHSSHTQVSNRSNKRPSKSPVTHESHQSKKRYFDYIDDRQSVPLYTTKSHQQSRNPVKIQPELDSQDPKESTEAVTDTTRSKSYVAKKARVEPMPDFIPITSLAIQGKQEQVIQDNEVSTSDAVASARIYITKDVVEKLNGTNGEDWLKDMRRKHNVAINLNTVESLLIIDGNPNNQEAFQTDLRVWAQGIPKNKLESIPKPNVEVPNDEQSQLTYNIPKNKDSLLLKLNLAFESLKQNLGDPKSIFKELNYAQNKHERLTKQKVISPKQLSNNRVHINDLLKKLNMILLGQAGLGEGWRHLRDLRTLMDRVNSFKSKNVSKALREQIGLHYRLLFTPNHRNDYSELLKRYDVSKSKNRVGGIKRRVVEKREFKGHATKVALKPPVVDVEMGKPHNNKNLLMQNLRKEMVLCQGQLAHSKPMDMRILHTRNRLIAQMKSFVNSIDSNVSISSKMLKKMWRVQVQAAQFLTKA